MKLKRTKFGISFKYLIITTLYLIFITDTVCAQDAVAIKKTKAGILISNGLVMSRFTYSGVRILQEYYAKKGNQWILVVKSFDSPSVYPPDAVQLFNNQLDINHRFLLTAELKRMKIIHHDKNTAIVQLDGGRGKNTFQQTIALNKNDYHFSIIVKTELGDAPYKVDYALSPFVFNSSKMPEFVHTPTLKFDNNDSKQNRFKLLAGKDQIIGDRAFHAPAIILQDKGIFAALVPNLNIINESAVTSKDARRTIDIGRNMFSVPIDSQSYTMPTGLDLNIKTGLTPKPIFTFGYMDNIIAHHIRYQRTNGPEMIRTLTKGTLKYAFDLFVNATMPRCKGYETIAAYQWNKYGHPVFMNHPHLTMPFENYFKVVDSITFHHSKYQDIDIPLNGYEDYGSWLQFDMDGVPVGGYRSAVNFWNDVIHNSIFWNNARDASGFWFWGKKLNRPDFIDKANRIINFCLLAPRNKDGLFATLYNANSKTWGLQFSDPPNGKAELFLRQSGSYDIAAMSKTGAHLLDYYFRCEKNKKIIPYLTPYANWIIAHIDNNGSLPSYVTTDMVGSPLLKNSAQPASSMWFLASMYIATHQEKYKIAAKRISEYLEKEIIPEAKWMDMEQYYSCGAKPIAFQKDVWQNEPVRGNLATIWACEGYARLYEATNEKKYLTLGVSCINYLSFSQCIWAPHFIYTALPFGGFTADNSDNSTMLDARQAETVKPFIWYGKILNRQDLLERGIAAARSSVVLMNLPSHKANDIYKYTNIYPYGLGPENIDHEGHPQSAMRTSPSWGEGSGVFTGLAEAYRELEGGYIDFENNIYVGVNGVRIQKASVHGSRIDVFITDALANLKLAFDEPFVVPIRLHGLKKKSYSLYINNALNGMIVNKEQHNIINLQITPNGHIKLVK